MGLNRVLRAQNRSFRFEYGWIAGVSAWLLLYLSPRYLPGEKPPRVFLISLGLGILIFLMHRALHARPLRATEWGTTLALKPRNRHRSSCSISISRSLCSHFRSSSPTTRDHPRSHPLPSRIPLCAMDKMVHR